MWRTWTQPSWLSPCCRVSSQLGVSTTSNESRTAAHNLQLFSLNRRLQRRSYKVPHQRGTKNAQPGRLKSIKSEFSRNFYNCDDAITPKSGENVFKANENKTTTSSLSNFCFHGSPDALSDDDVFLGINLRAAGVKFKDFPNVTQLFLSSRRGRTREPAA